MRAALVVVLLAAPLALADPQLCQVDVVLTHPGADAFEADATACTDWWLSFWFLRAGKVSLHFDATAPRGTMHCDWLAAETGGACDGDLFVETGEVFHVAFWLSEGVGAVQGSVHQ